ncbi:HU family DNA-binding protein [Cellulomonas sp. KRMCY2]|uniref:HU family DNA-binding protein n=1 Tax=Cellulomonas sp. KRMCY2 TaxID=1304865 RepID=UPI00045E83B6|nr:HU family DNA-binding protein [Cellulomonas sp. KRMCY2]
MNKTELLAMLEVRLGSRGAAVAALDTVLDEIQQAIAAGERVTLTGFGTFERVERPARIGRNPRTGAALEIAASAGARFHAGSALKAAVAGGAPATRTAVVVASSGPSASVAAKGTVTTKGTAAKGTVTKSTAAKPTAAASTKKPKVKKAEKPGKKSSSGKAAGAKKAKKKK